MTGRFARRNSAFLLLLTGLTAGGVFAQCSDAGVCAVGRQQAGFSHEISFTYQFGRSAEADDLTFHTLQLAAVLQIFDGSRLSAALPFNRQSGPLGSTAGAGDLLVLWSQTLLDDGVFRLGFQVGGKLALADVNAKSLPQSYQSGLGTNDLLAGITSEYEHWNLAVAYQFSQERSANRLDRLKRGGDVLLKIGYSSQVDDWRIGGEVLAIKRLQESSVLTSAPGTPETFGRIAGSNQTQINLLGRAGYRIGSRLELQGMTAFPLLNRKVNIDGLTRSLSFSLGIAYLF